MSRPHEDRQRHTLVDHRPGGSPIAFSAGGWCAIEVVDVKADRAGAALSAYETLVEQSRTSATKIIEAALFRSENSRRIVAFVGLSGHEAYRHLRSEWDDHHLEQQHRAVAESSSGTLFRTIASIGKAEIDASTTDAYVFERVSRDLGRKGTLAAALTAADGFVGALQFSSDAGDASALLYRFAHAAQFDAFRAGAAALDLLGAADASGHYPVHAIKTL